MAAPILGFDAELMTRHYAKEGALKEKEQKGTTIRQEPGGKIDGLLLLKRQEVDKKQALLDAFDFRTQDKAETRQLVDQVDGRIAAPNQRRYALTHNRKKVIASLDEDQSLS